MPDDQIDPLYPNGLELFGHHTMADRDVVLLVRPQRISVTPPQYPHRDRDDGPCESIC